MKTLIIGMQGVGVTTFIKNKIIPALPNIDDLQIFDFCNEYLGDPKNRVDLSQLLLRDRNSVVLRSIYESNNNTVFVFDGHKVYLNSEKDETKRHSHQWLYDALQYRKSILSFNSIKLCDLLNLSKPNPAIEKIYLFRTLDDKKTIEDLKAMYKDKIELIPQFALNV